MRYFLLFLALAVAARAEVRATAAVGDEVTLSATASGTQPFRYQWLRGGIGGVDIAGQTAPALTLKNVQLADADVYACRVLNDAGAATSENAILTVVQAPPPPPPAEPPSDAHTKIVVTPKPQR